MASNLVGNPVHTLRVMRLYRNVLMTTYDWVVHRRIFLEKAKEIRAAFDANKNVTDDIQIEKLVLKGQDWLYEHMHPEPYIFNTLPGGSKYQRNTPPPDWLVRGPVYDHHGHGHAHAEGDHHDHHDEHHDHPPAAHH
eukprot:c25759_g1_i1.p2 GENE.c25759_g1_i1~~c25759_g1_i1.p2  ORF type:complete len:137 (+),score=26.59 c25759_g1_i1:39-449(+)